MNVANFKAGSLTIQTARTKGRQPAFMREHRKRIRLIDDLRKLAAAEEVFDGRRNALGVDQAPRRDIVGILETHSLLDCATQLEEALANFIAGKFINRAQPTITQMVDVVDLHFLLAGREAQQIANGSD